MKQLSLLIPLIILLVWWQYPPPGTPTPTPPICNYDACPSGDTSGATDTPVLRAAVAGGGHIDLAPGDYYITKIDSQLGLVPVPTDNTTVDGGDWNTTTIYMVGNETLPGADWYMFHAVNRAGFTLQNITLDGSLMVTVAEQTHGVVATHNDGLTLQNVRGRYIYGDTAKIIYTCDNCRFVDTEHISNGRSGLAFRGQGPSPNLTMGGVLIDGFYAYDVSDQAIDMEPGLSPAEMTITNARIYAPDNPSICLSITGGGAEMPTNITISDAQIYCKTYLHDAQNVTISNSIFAAQNVNTALLIQKASGNVVISNVIIQSPGSPDGALKMTVHNTGRPNTVVVSNAVIETGYGMGIQLYDVANVTLSGIRIKSVQPLINGVYFRGVVAGVDRGSFTITDVHINGAANGIKFASTESGAQSVIDTLTIQGNHFRNVTVGILLDNPAYHTTPYVRAWNFDGNVFGEGVTTPVVIGSVFR